MASKDLDRLVVVEEILQNKVWFYEWAEPIRLVGVNIKVDSQGVLGILKARSAEGPKVAFVGAATLWGLAAKLRDQHERDKVRWRVDQFALDNLEKKG